MVKLKFDMKYGRQYKDVGKVVPPGVLVEENKRRKLLSELGMEMRTHAGQAAKHVEESKGEEMPESS